MHAALLILIAAALRTAPADTVPRALSCDPVALRSPLGSATDTVVLTLRPADGSNTRLPSPWAELTLQAIARHLVLPDPVPLPVWVPLQPGAPGTRWAAPDTIVPTISNAVLVVVTARGRLQGAPTLAASSLDEGADAALVHAVRAADRARAFAPAPVDSGAPHEAIRVLVGLEVAGRDTVTRRHPVALVRRDRLLLTEVPSPIAEGRRAPQYPEKMRRLDVEGSASVAYVVDERGAPVAATMLAARYTDWAFARAALDFVSGERLAPGRVSGCALPMLVRQPFQFRLEG